jgi:hypothetical protein
MKLLPTIKKSPSLHKLFVKNLEEEGYDLIGYIRKSKGKNNDATRIRLLEAMATRLRERSSVRTVYASPFSNSSDTGKKRDPNFIV